MRGVETADVLFEQALDSGVPVSTGLFEVGGRCVAIRCVGEAHWADLTASLLASTGGSPDLVLDVWDAGETGIRPERTADERAVYADHAEGFVYTPGGREVRHLGPEFDMRFDQETRVATGWVAADRVPAWHRLRPWQKIFVSALAGSGVESVHAAMVARDGGGVLLPGQNGAGKSSTTFACLAAGLCFLGDDAIAVELGEALPVGSTVHAVAKLSVEGLTQFPELAAISERHDDPDADERAIRLAGGSPLVVRSAAISAIAFPRLVDSQLSAVRPLAPVRAATELFGASLSLEPWRVGDAFGALSDLAGQAPAFTLEVGRDPARLAETVAGLLSV